MKKTIAMFFLALATVSTASAGDSVFDDVAITAFSDGKGINAGVTPFLKVGVCSLKELERTKDIRSCHQLKQFKTQSGQVSALEFYRSAREKSIEYGDAVLLLAIMETVPGWDAGSYIGHDIVSPFDLTIQKNLNHPFTVTTSKGAISYQMSLSLSPAAPKFQSYNAPSKIYDMDMMSDVLGKPAQDLKLFDYLWMTLLYYSSKDNAVWSQPLYSKSSPEFKALAALSKELQKDTTLDRAIRAYRSHVDSVSF